MRERLGAVVMALGVIGFSSLLWKEDGRGADTAWRLLLNWPGLTVLVCLVHAVKPNFFTWGWMTVLATLGLVMFASPATGVSLGDRAVFIGFHVLVISLLLWGRPKRSPRRLFVS